MRKILCSTGALLTRRNNRDHRLLEQIAPKIACDGFELLMYDSWYPIWEQVMRDVSQMGLRIPVLHADKGIGEMISRGGDGDSERAQELFEINCKMARCLGAEKLVLHLWGGLPSDSHIEDNIQQYFILKNMAGQYGLLLTVENVVCNKENPLAHWKRLAEEDPDAAFTLDTRFASFHGQLDLIFTDEYKWLWEGAVRHVHISDYCGGLMEWDKLRYCLHPGEGNINYEKFAADLNCVKYDNTITLESTSVLPDGDIDFAKLGASLEKIRKLLGR